MTCLLQFDMTSWYEGLVKLLWYSQIPCYDVKGVTSGHKGQQALLQKCMWKGISIPCSAIFETFPTDRGMCCAFNMEKADNIFKKGNYTKMVSYLQERDKNNSFGTSTPPKWYTKAGEPKPAPGRNKGLTVFLDAHTDQVAWGTVNEDYNGFMAYINERHAFPNMDTRGIVIRPGHQNNIVIRAFDVWTSNDTKNQISHEDRQCLFPDEMELKIHKHYSQVLDYISSTF